MTQQLGDIGEPVELPTRGRLLWASAPPGRASATKPLPAVASRPAEPMRRSIARRVVVASTLSSAELLVELRPIPSSSLKLVDKVHQRARTIQVLVRHSTTANVR
jgi:hypothetical protein